MGFIVFTLLVLLNLVMLSSLLFLFMEKCKINFIFLSNYFWILILLGLVIILSIGFTYIGSVTSFKCFMYPALLTFGFSFTIIPILHKLIISFPENNKISLWVEKHNYLFLFAFLLLDTICITLLYFNGFDTKVVILEDRQNYTICKMENKYGLLILYLLLGYKMLAFLLLSLLLFMEWNMEEIRYDIHYFISTIYIDVLSVILTIILNQISVNNYTIYFFIKELIIFTVVITNYILIYGYRIILSFDSHKDTEVKLYINTVHDIKDYQDKACYSSNISSEFESNENREFSNRGSVSTDNITSSSFVSKIMEYHNKRRL